MFRLIVFLIFGFFVFLCPSVALPCPALLCPCAAVDCLLPNCSGNGVCLHGQCQCFNGYKGSDCSLADKINVTLVCAKNCSGHGVFDVDEGACVCERHFTGDDCETGNHCPAQPPQSSLISSARSTSLSLSFHYYYYLLLLFSIPPVGRWNAASWERMHSIAWHDGRVTWDSCFWWAFVVWRATMVRHGPWRLLPRLKMLFLVQPPFPATLTPLLTSPLPYPTDWDID